MLGVAIATSFGRLGWSGLVRCNRTPCGAALIATLVSLSLKHTPAGCEMSTGGMDAWSGHRWDWL